MTIQAHDDVTSFKLQPTCITRHGLDFDKANVATYMLTARGMVFPKLLPASVHRDCAKLLMATSLPVARMLCPGAGHVALPNQT